ncbi:MAG: hypothetical protein Q8N39_04245 [Pelolinea sp.]|nr:hypothetical protein [Pelolinea sp.]
MKKFPKWVFIIAGIFMFIVIGACGAGKPTTAPVDPNAIRTQIASTVIAGIMQTAQANVTPTLEVTSTPEATSTPEFTATPTVKSPPSFGDGTWRVGIDIEPGTYRIEGTGSCYWERLSGFTGALDDIIANDLPNGPSIVTILPSDIGFTSSRCGIWVLQK